MGRINYSVSVNATPEKVFAIVSDVESSPDRIDWCEKVEILTDGPIRVGTKWRETRRVNNKQSVEVWEMTAFESPNFFSAYCDSQGYDVEWSMRVIPEGNSSRLTFDMTTKPRTCIGKLLTPLEWLMSGLCKRMIQKDLGKTKAFIEQVHP